MDLIKHSMYTGREKQCVKGIATVLAGLMAAQTRKPNEEGPNTLLYVYHGRTVRGKILANRCALYDPLK